MHGLTYMNLLRPKYLFQSRNQFARIFGFLGILETFSIDKIEDFFWRDPQY